jgi:hypothetical protein
MGQGNSYFESANILIGELTDAANRRHLIFTYNVAVAAAARHGRIRRAKPL